MCPWHFIVHVLQNQNCFRIGVSLAAALIARSSMTAAHHNFVLEHRLSVLTFVLSFFRVLALETYQWLQELPAEHVTLATSPYSLEVGRL